MFDAASLRALAAEAWCDGRVVMWGGSYAGFAQWATAAKAPPHLAAIAPAASVYPGFDFPMRANVWQPYAVRWLTLVDGRRVNNGLFDDEQYWRDLSRDHAEAGRPFDELDRAAIGRTIPTFQRWLDHPQLDEFWDRLAPSDDELRAMSIPVLTITGHYDDDQAGALRFFRRHTALSPSAKDHHLLMGPWDHAGTRTPAPTFGGLTFAHESVVDLVGLHVDWYDWVLGRRRTRPDLLQDGIVYYHAGEERWRSAATLRGLGTKPARLYLAPDGADTRHGRVRGRLTTVMPSKEGVLRYRSDPGDAASANRDEPPHGSPFIAAAEMLQPGRDRVICVSEPLAEDLDVTGSCRLVLRITTALPDADVSARLYEVGDGSAVFLSDDLCRLRYLDSRRAGAPYSKEHVVLELAAFSFFSRRIAKGRRLALVLGPPDRTYEVNHQAGFPRVASETGRNAISGTVEVRYGGLAAGSYLELPVRPRS